MVVAKETIDGRAIANIPNPLEDLNDHCDLIAEDFPIAIAVTGAPGQRPRNTTGKRLGKPRGDAD